MKTKHYTEFLLPLAGFLAREFRLLMFHAYYVTNDRKILPSNLVALVLD